MLVAAPRKGSADARAMTEHLDELAQLVDTAGAEVVARVSQHVVSPNPATLIGEGKVEELRAAVADAGILVLTGCEAGQEMPLVKLWLPAGALTQMPSSRRRASLASISVATGSAWA